MKTNCHDFTPPEGTTKVNWQVLYPVTDLVRDINCAEFCDHQHQFQVNDGEVVTKTHPEAGTAMGCAEQVAIGTVPNQSGLGSMDVLDGVQVWKFPFGGMISLMMSICLERTHCPILALYGEKSIIPHILLELLDHALIWVLFGVLPVMITVMRYLKESDVKVGVVLKIARKCSAIVSQ